MGRRRRRFQGGNRRGGRGRITGGEKGGEEPLLLRFILALELKGTTICPSTVITMRSSKLFVPRLVGSLKMMAPLIARFRTYPSLLFIILDLCKRNCIIFYSFNAHLFALIHVGSSFSLGFFLSLDLFGFSLILILILLSWVLIEIVCSGM